jgi:ADP-heptose:LPS heptosyltransferase
MLESLRRSLGVRMSAWHFRRMRNNIISFADTMSTGDHALLILPLTPTTQSPASVIELVRARFPDGHLTIVAEEHDTGAAVLLPRSTIVRMSPSGVDWLFRPSRALTQQIARHQYDLAIDLNLDSLLPSAYICRESNARVRIGFARPGADLFYNFQMQPDAARSGALYDRLAACLKMF